MCKEATSASGWPHLVHCAEGVGLLLGVEAAALALGLCNHALHLVARHLRASGYSTASGGAGTVSALAKPYRCHSWWVFRAVQHSR